MSQAPTQPTLEGIAAGIDLLLGGQAQQKADQASSPSAIDNPISLTAAMALAQAKGWSVETNLNVNPMTISFFMNIGGAGKGLVQTVGLTLP